MSTQINNILTGSVASSVGKPVGVLPVMMRDRPPASLSRTGKLTGKSGSVRDGDVRCSSGRNQRKHPGHAISHRDSSRERTKSSIRVSPSTSTKKQKKRCDSYDGGEQDIVFIDVPREDGATSEIANNDDQNLKKSLGNINREDILLQSQETDVNKVYEINLHASNIGQISNLDQFKKLRVVDLSCNGIDRIQNLEQNQDIRELKLYDNRIRTIENLDKLKELCHLQLQHNRIRSIGKGLSCLKKLKILRLDSNQILKLEPGEVAGCSQVTTLDISSNMLDNLSALNSLPNLAELSATNNRLRSVGDLSRCRKLQEVDLSFNRLTDLSGLKSLPHLHTLNVSNNQLTSVKELGKLKCLQELSVADNSIKSMSSFPEQFPNLEILNISNNRLNQLSDVLVLRDSKLLVELYLSGNPITEQDPVNHSSIQTELPGLEILDGVTLKRSSGKISAPLMRPMSASSVISVRYVENQMKALADELQAFESSFSQRFESFKVGYDSLPAEPPSSTSSSQKCHPDNGAKRPSNSRCSSRSKIKLAQEFAASQQFD